MNGWIGVDLDGTLAFWEKNGKGIGEPVPLMLERVKKWLINGWDVRIFTARAAMDPKQIPEIEKWCEIHLGCCLPVTCQKDGAMIELWDDRAVQIERNTGLRSDGIVDYEEDNDIGILI